MRSERGEGHVGVLALADEPRQRIARPALVLAAVVGIALVTWDPVGMPPLAVGVAGHELRTVLVRLDGLRLLVRPGRAAPGPSSADARSLPLTPSTPR